MHHFLKILYLVVKLNFLFYKKKSIITKFLKNNLQILIFNNNNHHHHYKYSNLPPLIKKIKMATVTPRKTSISSNKNKIRKKNSIKDKVIFHQGKKKIN